MKKTIQIRKLTVAAAIGLMLAAPVQWGSSAQAQNRTITLANISASTPAKKQLGYSAS